MSTTASGWAFTEKSAPGLTFSAWLDGGSRAAYLALSGTCGPHFLPHSGYQLTRNAVISRLVAGESEAKR